MTNRWSPENKKLYQQAEAAGCAPEWSDGMFGPAWRCTCEDNRHGIDQQCSDLKVVNK